MKLRHFLAHLLGINIVRLERWERGEPDEQKELVYVRVCSCGQVKGLILGGDGWKPLKKIRDEEWTQSCTLCHGCLPPGEICQNCHRKNIHDIEC